MSENSKIDFCRMTIQERAYAKELLAGSLLEGFSALLNTELAYAIADKSITEITTIQEYACKQL